MPYPLNNYTTTDSFTDAGTAIFSPAKSSFSMIVTGASVSFQLAPSIDAHPEAASFLRETFLPPGRYNFDESDSPTGRIAMARVRSWLTGANAQVSIT